MEFANECTLQFATKTKQKQNKKNKKTLQFVSSQTQVKKVNHLHMQAEILLNAECNPILLQYCIKHILEWRTRLAIIA